MSTRKRRCCCVSPRGDFHLVRIPSVVAFETDYASEVCVGCIDESADDMMRFDGSDEWKTDLVVGCIVEGYEEGS